MELSTYLSREKGRAARLAKRIAKPPAYLSQIASRKRPAPPALVPALEALCGHEVRRWDLRPDDWHLIWPELVGTQGAPVPPQRGIELAS